MGLFDIFRRRKPNAVDTAKEFLRTILPQGEKDKEAGTQEVLHILNGRVGHVLAQNIFIKSYTISKISPEFDEARLRSHLAGYCIDHFNDDQIKRLHGYLIALSAAMLIHRKSPADVKRSGEIYLW